MPELSEYSAEIAVSRPWVEDDEEATVSFDRPHIEADCDGEPEMALSILATTSFDREPLAEALVEHDLGITDDHWSDWLSAVHIAGYALDYDAMEAVFQAVLDGHDEYAPDRYQLVEYGSPGTTHVALVTLW